jgi:CRISPR/Cas system CSM-associated protein Csm2 small subunit
VFRKDLNTKLEDMKTTAQQERERRHKEVIEAITKSHEALGKKIDQQDKRIRALENWRWYVLGVAAVIMLIITKFPWSALF